ncbi:MAG: esterase [Candidatus Eisenbacteria bacterium]|uniref:Esterase n=1 Tax=Eiseniibacteriota bacterium TaxID=2212470 RepID=A0A849SKH2_UNCEI|nr:esterase [Candidatus Eisenbacteria bacterium]
MKRGEVRIERFESALLRGNASGDPHERAVPVYLPPSYANSESRRYPMVFVLTGFTGRGRMLLNDSPWSPALPDRLDMLIANHACEEMIVVMPDAFTRFGGSQYLNSSATGRYEDHLIEELVPWADRSFRTLASPAHRGVVGKSSGGYGALVLGMRHPDVFGAVASHSGDVCFDYCYRPDIPKVCSLLQHAGGLAAFMNAFEAKLQKKHDDFTVLNLLGMAAAYSPNPATPPFGFDLPFDLESGEFRAAVWERWLAHDPLALIEAHAAALRGMRLVYLDCGTRDEWSLHLGARMLARRLTAHGVAHQHLEFDDAHMNVSYRYDESLPRIGRALTANSA